MEEWFADHFLELTVLSLLRELARPDAQGELVFDWVNQGNVLRTVELVHVRNFLDVLNLLFLVLWANESLSVLVPAAEGRLVKLV